MPVDPALQAVLDLIASTGDAGLETMTPDEARAMYKTLSLPPGPPTAVAAVENRTVLGASGEIAVRIYTPDGDGPFGALVWLHGGGWVIGDLDTADETARRL